MRCGRNQKCKVDTIAFFLRTLLAWNSRLSCSLGIKEMSRLDRSIVPPVPIISLCQYVICFDDGFIVALIDPVQVVVVAESGAG